MLSIYNCLHNYIHKNLLCQDLHLSEEKVFDKLLVRVHPNTWDDSRISLQLME